MDSATTSEATKAVVGEPEIEQVVSPVIVVATAATVTMPETVTVETVHDQAVVVATAATETALLQPVPAVSAPPITEAVSEAVMQPIQAISEAVTEAPAAASVEPILEATTTLAAPIFTTAAVHSSVSVQGTRTGAKPRVIAAGLAPKRLVQIGTD